MRIKLRAVHATWCLGLGLCALALNPYGDSSAESRITLGLTGLGLLGAPTSKVEKALDENDRVLFGKEPSGEKK